MNHAYANSLGQAAASILWNCRLGTSTSIHCGGALSDPPIAVLMPPADFARVGGKATHWASSAAWREDPHEPLERAAYQGHVVAITLEIDGSEPLAFLVPAALVARANAQHPVAP